jgi:hypothetical protein
MGNLRSAASRIFSRRLSGICFSETRTVTWGVPVVCLVVVAGVLCITAGLVPSDAADPARETKPGDLPHVPGVDSDPTNPTGARVNRTMMIDFDGGRLTVKLQAVPLETTLKEIERRAAIEISVLGALAKDISSRNISMEFQDLPLVEGLERLLSGYGYMLAYSGAQGGGSLRKVIVVQSDTGVAPGRREDALRPAKKTLVRAVAARLDRSEVKGPLDTYLHESDARVRRDAFQDLIGAVEVEDFELLIGLLQDENVKPAEWKVALAPFSDVITWRERRYILASLEDKAAREGLVNMLESVLLYKAREEAKKRNNLD